ncbi:MAG: hypothetical protein ACJAQ6_000689 [Arenicella sp.]|jgi:hypothetical protein
MNLENDTRVERRPQPVLFCCQYYASCLWACCVRTMLEVCFCVCSVCAREGEKVSAANFSRVKLFDLFGRVGYQQN